MDLKELMVAKFDTSSLATKMTINSILCKLVLNLENETTVTVGKGIGARGEVDTQP